MATDGSALGTVPATHGRCGTGRRLPFAVRLLLLAAFCFLVWCGLAVLASPAASAAEAPSAGQSSGLLDSDLLGRTTDSVASVASVADVADSVTSGEPASAGTPRADRPADEDAAKPERASAHGDGRIGSLTASAVRTADRSLAPVRAVLDPAGEHAVTDLRERSTPIRPVLLSAHGVGQGVLGGVVTELAPVTGAAPFSVSMPVALDAVTAPHGGVTGAGKALAAPAQTSSAAEAADTAALAGDDGPAAANDGQRPDGDRVPAQQNDDTDPGPAGAPAAPTGTTSSSTQLGNGSGSAGSHAFAELTRMLAAWRPSAVLPTTDADISSRDEGRPSVSPD